VEEGGCGEDWWHPECLVGLTREEYLKSIEMPKVGETNGSLEKEAAEVTNRDSDQATEIETEQNGNGPTKQSETSGQPIAVGPGADGNDIAAQAEEGEGEESRARRGESRDRGMREGVEEDNGSDDESLEVLE